MRSRQKGRLLVAVAALGFLLLNPPLLDVAAGGTRLLGVPALWAYLFAAWALVIALVALVVRSSRPG